jgi:hypothetical protein
MRNGALELVLIFSFAALFPHVAEAGPHELCTSVAEDIVGQPIELFGERSITARELHKTTAIQVDGLQTQCVADMNFSIIFKDNIEDAEVPKDSIEQAAYDKFCWGIYSSGADLVEKFRKPKIIEKSSEGRSDLNFIVAGNTRNYRIIGSDIDAVFALISINSAVESAKINGGASNELTRKRVSEVDAAIASISQLKRLDFEARCVGKAERDAAAAQKAKQDEADRIAEAARLEAERPAREKAARDAANAPAISELERRVRLLTTERAQTLKSLAVYERSAPAYVAPARKKLTDIDGELSRLQRELVLLR